MDGFGFVVPLVESRRILSGSFSSVKYPGRAPDGFELIRVFVGGACQAELVDLPDAQLRQLVVEELADLLSVEGQPTFCNTSSWPNVMPQYYLGHTERVAKIESLVGHRRGLRLAGNAYHGVGIPACIHSGERAAEQIVAQFASTADTGTLSDTVPEGLSDAGN